MPHDLSAVRMLLQGHLAYFRPAPPTAAAVGNVLRSLAPNSRPCLARRRDGSYHGFAASPFVKRSGEHGAQAKTAILK
jgi:hypothetical protein